MNLFNRYTEDSLVDDEKIVFETTKHWINFFSKTFFITTSISIYFFDNPWIFLGIAILNITSYEILIKTDECVITNKRVIFKTGFIFSHTIEMNLNKIESLYVKQNVLGLYLGYGTVMIKGTGGSLETFLRINKPLQIRKKIQEYSF